MVSRIRLRAYHGSGALFNKFEQLKSRIINDHYGGGIAYFTDSEDIAISYAENASKRQPLNERLAVIYHVDLEFFNLFDIDDIFTGKNLSKICQNNTEQFARSAGLLNYGTDRFQTIAELKSGNAQLTGDQVFKGLSLGQVKTSTARDALKRLGYDGLRYNGGLLVPGTRQHDVYLAYYEKNIKVVDRTVKVFA